MKIIVDTDLFAMLVKQTGHADGTTTFRCRLGLWAVNGSNVDKVRAEARHYFIQYLQGGEYNEWLKAKMKNGRKND